MSFKGFTLGTLFGGKPWYRSMTAWAQVVLLAAETIVPALAALELADPEQMAALTSCMEKLWAVMTALGIRRAVIPNGKAIAAVGLVALLSLGCGVHVGPTGLDVVLGGSFYTHVDKQADKGKGAAVEGEDASGASEWTTHATRTWGTSGIEGIITDESETITIQGEGLSKNLSETLGKDIVKTAVEAALKSTPTGAALAAGKALLGGDEVDPSAILEDLPPDVEGLQE